MRRLLLLLAVLALLAAGCGDDSSGGNGLGIGGDGDSGDDDGAGDSGDDDGGGGGEGSGTEFCDLWTSDGGEDFFADIDFFSATPDELEEAYRRALDQFDDARRGAPDPIRGDVDTLYESFESIIDELEAVDWDFFALAEDNNSLENPEADAAQANIDEFCGVDNDPFDPSDFTTDPSIPEDFDPANADDIAVQIFMGLGHDEETARCLAEELGPDFDAGDPGPDILDQEFCGLTFIEIMSGGGG